MALSRDHRDYQPVTGRPWAGVTLLAAAGSRVRELVGDLRAVLGIDPPPGEQRVREPLFRPGAGPSKDPDDYRWGRNEG